MMKPVTSSTDIHRYVDGEMAPDEARAFKHWLDNTPEAAKEVALLQKQNTDLRNAIPQPDPDALARLAQNAARHRPGKVQTFAAAIALLALGFFGGYAVSLQRYDQEIARLQAVGETVVRTAAAAHSLYSVELLHPVEVAASERKHLNTWLSKRLGATIKAPELDGSDYHLIGGRLLPSGTRAAALYMYENEAGDRVSLFATRAGSGKDSSFKYETVNSLPVVHWTEGQWTYVIAGDRADVLQKLAREFSGELV